jgi:O-antigen/teichoic acid export membrane protein
MTKDYIVSSFAWGVVAKVTDAAIKFISLPFLLLYFGKVDFGLIALATSVNAYLQLLDLGVNTGAVKYFSEWIGSKDYKLLDDVARTSITFYTVIGILNTLLLVLIAFFGIKFFSISAAQEDELRMMLLILAFFSLISWSTSVFSQLLIANEDIAYIEKIGIIRSLLSLIVIGLTINFSWSVISYFTWFTLANCVVVIPFYIKAKKNNLISNFIPGLDWKKFKVVLNYSLAIVIMGVFQMSATKLRPIILSLFSNDGIGLVSEYRVLETITVFIISIGGMFITIFMPKVSKLLLKNDIEIVRSFAYQATSYTSIVCVLLCMPFIICGRDILELYVGDGYSHLVPWLVVWVITILFTLHNSPVASLVLATGKTRMLVYSSALSCIISLVVNAFLAKEMGVGAAVIGYAVYAVIQMSFYYFYYNNRVLYLNSWLIFRSFIIPVLLGLLSILIVYMLHVQITHLLIQIVVKLILWGLFFAGSLIIFRVIGYKDYQSVFKI